MKENLELFALLAAMLMGVMGAMSFFAALKEYKKLPTENSSQLLMKTSVVLFIIAGLFLIPGRDYFYTSGFWHKPAVPESKPPLTSNPPSQPVTTSNPQKTEQTTSQPLGPVYNSGWDGSVRQVKQWLKDNLKDPASFEAIEWSSVQKTPDGDYLVRCKYRAKNSFGGFEISNQIFYMDSEGNVLRCVDVSE